MLRVAASIYTGAIAATTRYASSPPAARFTQDGSAIPSCTLMCLRM